MPERPMPSGPWSTSTCDAFLDEVRVPLRIACHGEDHPLLASLWFLRDGGTLWCATPAHAQVVRRLERDPRCAFEVSLETPPYQGVRGTAVASLHPERGLDVLRALIERYLGANDPDLATQLLSRPDPEMGVAITPKTLVSWDYRSRMSATAASAGEARAKPS